MSVLGAALYKFDGDSSGLVRAAEAGQKSIAGLTKEEEQYNRTQRDTAERSKITQLAMAALGGVITVTGARFATLAIQTGSVSKAASLLGQDFAKIGSSIKTFGETAFKFISSGQLADSIVNIATKLGTMAKIGFEGLSALTSGGLSLIAPFKSIVRIAELASFAFSGLALAMSSLGGAAGAIAPIFAKLSGSSLILVGVLDIILVKIGQLIQNFGSMLTNAAKNFLHIANDIQREMFGLKVAVEGYQRATGDASVTASEFNSIIAKMSSVTNLSRAEISRGVLVMLDMAQITGVNAEQIAILTERAADFASVTGQDFQTVIYGIDQAMRGFPRVAASMGLALNETELAQTHFVREVGKGVDQLTQAERATAFYELILEKTAFTVGKSAVAAQETFAGSIAATESRLRNIHGEIGRGVQGAWFPLQKALLDIVTVMEQGVSPAIYRGIGGFIAIAGPAAQFTGFIIEMASKLALVAFGVSLLIKAFPALGASLGVLAAQIGIATTSWTAFNASMLLMLKNPVVLALIAIGAAIIGVSIAMGVLVQDTKSVTQRNAELMSEYQRLSSQTLLTVEDMKRMKEIIKELEKEYPGLSKAIEGVTDDLKAQSRIVTEIHIGKLTAQLEDTKKRIEELNRLGTKAQPLPDSPFAGPLSRTTRPQQLSGDTSGGNAAIKAELQDLLKLRKDTEDALAAQQKKLKPLIVDEFLTQMNIELSGLEIQFKTLGTVSQEVFVNQMGKHLAEVMKKASEVQQKVVTSINDITNPDLKKKAVELFTAIMGITQQTSDSVFQLALRVRDLNREFESPTGNIRRQIVEQQALIDRLKRQPLNPQNKDELEQQEKILAGLLVRYKEVMKEMSIQTKFFIDNLADAGDEAETFAIKSMSHLTKEARDAAKEFIAFAYGLDNTFVPAAIELIDKTDKSQFSILRLRAAVSNFGGEAFEGMRILNEELSKVAGEGQLTGFPAVEEAIRRTKFRLDELNTVAKQLLAAETFDAEGKQGGAASTSQMSVDVQKEVDRLRNADLVDQRKLVDEKIKEMQRWQVESGVIEQYRARQLNIIRDEEIRRARQRFDDNLVKDLTSVDRYLTEYKNILQSRGLPEAEQQKELALERERIRQELVSRESAVAESMIRNAQNVGQAIEGIARKSQIAWEQSFGSIGGFTETTLGIVTGAFSNTFGKLLRGEIKSFEDFIKDFLKGFAEAWLNAIQKIVAELIVLWLWQKITGLLASASNTGAATAGTGGAGIGNDAIQGGFTSTTASSGVLAGRITSIPMQSRTVHNQPLTMFGSYAMGAAMGRIPDTGGNKGVPIIAHPNELVLNEDQQVLMAAALRGERPGEAPGTQKEAVTNIEIVFAKDLQDALREPDPNKITAIVNSNILRLGSVRKTIRQAR